jgi:hypothetical protein
MRQTLPRERTGRLDRRTKLKPQEQALLQKLQRGTWRLDELRWLEAHLAPDAPLVLVGELRARMQALGCPIDRPGSAVTPPAGR